MLKMTFVIYIGFSFLLTILGVFKSDEVDENGFFKIPWLFIAGLILLIVSPIIGKICGLV